MVRGNAGTPFSVLPLHADYRAALAGDCFRDGTGRTEHEDRLGIWDRIAADDRVAFVPEPDDLELRFRKYSGLASASPKVWADAYLLTFAQALGLTLVTFDHALGNRAAQAVVIG